MDKVFFVQVKDRQMFCMINEHCQPSKQSLVETCPGVDDRTKNKNWKTKKHTGPANTNVGVVLLNDFLLTFPEHTFRLWKLDDIELKI